jgi:hypothetical protein
MFEQDIQYDCNTYSEYGSVFIRGRLDAVTKDTVWELKCVESLTMDHFLQLIIYAYMWKREYEELNGVKDFKLLNLRTGEVYKLNRSSYLIEEVIKILLDNKYAKKPEGVCYTADNSTGFLKVTYKRFLIRNKKYGN